MHAIVQESERLYLEIIQLMPKRTEEFDTARRDRKAIFGAHLRSMNALTAGARARLRAAVGRRPPEDDLDSRHTEHQQQERIEELEGKYGWEEEVKGKGRQQMPCCRVGL